MASLVNISFSFLLWGQLFGALERGQRYALTYMSRRPDQMVSEAVQGARQAA